MAHTAVRPAAAMTPAPGLDPAGATPMMAQYIEIKAANPDCLLFYRMGDFYELFFEDAEIASRALGIVLTKRGKHAGSEIPMCGVPVERSDDYLNRLIALGHRVAVCEQTEDPAEAKKRGAKSVVRREVVRLVTAGTITEDRLLDPARANLLLAVGRLPEQYGVSTLDGFAQFTRAEIAAAGAVLLYIARTQLAARPTLAVPTREDGGATLAIDAATRANLELTRTLSGERTGSLLA